MVSSQLPVTSAPKNLTFSSGLFGHLHICVPSHTYTPPHIYIVTVKGTRHAFLSWVWGTPFNAQLLVALRRQRQVDLGKL